MRRIHTVLAVLAPLLMGADLDTAQRHLQTGDFRSAQREFRAVTEQTPSLAAGWIGLARSYAGLGRCQEAVEAFAPWRDATGYNARAASAEGWCWYRLGEYAQATASADDALLLKPNLAPAIYLRALTESAMGDEAAFEQSLVELYPTRRGDVMVVLAQAWDAVERGDDVMLDLSLEELSGLAVSYPRAGVRAQMAMIDAQRLLDLGDAYQAERRLAEVQDTGDEQVRIQLMRAEALRRLGRTGGARMILSQAHLKSRTASLPRSIRVRVLADLGVTEAPLERVDELLASPHPEDLASGWYLARAVDDEALAQTFRERWEVANQCPDRELEDLIPAPVEPL